MSCAVCVASNRRAVDAFLAGFGAGFRTAVVSSIEGAGEVTHLERPTFCLAHEAMVTRVYADGIRDCLAPQAGKEGE